MGAMQRHWDIFCRVIDNFGDIGVCWRLARQLRAEYGALVRLWVDDLAALASLCPSPSPQQANQTLEGIEIKHWCDPWLPVEAADVVIEAFACELPKYYLQAMAKRTSPPCWINLEYLSAEAWVEDCHGLASPHPSLPLTKYFFFPGFTPQTGGLLREAGAMAQRRAFSGIYTVDCPLEISLFCYDMAPVGELLDTWAAGERPIRCLVPEGKPLLAVKRHFQGDGPWHRGNLEVIPIPFVPQADFDDLLRRCDINFVRGEDSFVRAQWAAKPFVWHIYPQAENAHLPKLEAFLDIYTAGLPAAASAAAKHLFFAWNSGQGLPAAWNDFISQLPVLARQAKPWADSLAAQGDLAGKLVKFCRGKL